MNTTRCAGKGAEGSSSSSLSAEALEYYRLYAGNDDLPKYFCGSYELSSHIALPKPSEAHIIPEVIIEECENVPGSPTSSVASNKKLEWDNAADIGYANCDPSKIVHKSVSMPILKDKAESTPRDAPSNENKRNRQELMAFLKMKVGLPVAESTPYLLDTRKSGSDPEIYVSNSPLNTQETKKPQTRLSATVFNIELPSDDQPKEAVTASSSSSSVYSSASADKTINTSLPNKTKYLKRVQQIKWKNLKICKPVSLDCVVLIPKTDSGTQTTSFTQPKNASIGIQTSNNNSTNQEVLFLIHPSMQCEKSTGSSGRTTTLESDQAFSNCNSFEYVTAKETEAETKKISTSSSQSTKNVSSSQSTKNLSSSSSSSVQNKNVTSNSLRIMNKLIKSKKIDDSIKEAYIRKMAKSILSNDSDPSSESDKIVPQFERNLNTDQNQWSESTTNKSASIKVVNSISSSTSQTSKDWKNSQNETQSEKRYSSPESSDAPKETLIEFAKRERASQIDWINNEIDHLVKLKSLLETKKKSTTKTLRNITIPKTPNYEKSTAIYMITTQKGKDGHDACPPDCSSKSKQSSDGRIDFHIHNNLGVRDYQFKEIITKITPEQHHPCSYKAKSDQSFVSDLNNHQQCMINPCNRICPCCPPCRPCPDPCALRRSPLPSTYHRSDTLKDIQPVPATELPRPSTRSRSNSPQSISVTNELCALRKCKAKCSSEIKDCKANKDSPNKSRLIKSASHKNALAKSTSSKNAPNKCNDETCKDKADHSTCIPANCDERNRKYTTEDSDVSRYESVKKHAKSANHKKQRAESHKSTKSLEKSGRAISPEYKAAGGRTLSSPESYRKRTSTDSKTSNAKQSPTHQKGDFTSYRAYKAQKLKEKAKAKMKCVCINTDGIWVEEGEGEFLICDNSDDQRETPMSLKAKDTECQYNEAATISLQTEGATTEKGMRTDADKNGKEIQVGYSKPIMKQIGIGDMVQKEDKESGSSSVKETVKCVCRGRREKTKCSNLSCSPASVVTYAPSGMDTFSKKDFKLVKDLSNVNLNSAVVISSVITTSVANPDDNIRRLVLEMPLSSEGSKRESGDQTDKPKEQQQTFIESSDSNGRFSSARNSVSGNSSFCSMNSQKLGMGFSSSNEVICSCCGKCIANSESSLALGDHQAGGGLFCWPCYHQSTHRDWNPQQPYYQQPDHRCNCYSQIDEDALNKIRETLRELEEIDDNCQATESRLQFAGSCDRMVCQSCNKKIKRDHKLQKPVAYVLKFEPGEEPDNVEEKKESLQEILVKVPVQKPKKKRYSDSENGRRSSRTKSDQNLQDCLASRRPDFVRSAEDRRRCLIELAYMREQRSQKYKQLLAMTNGNMAPNPYNYTDDKKHLFSTKEMKRITAKNFKNLPEVQQKILEHRDRESKKTNRLLASIFNEKLRRNVLRGQASLSTSISVFNLT